MIKLIQNELIKIFKRKSIYFLFFLSLIVVVIYNCINPDQNELLEYNDTKDIPISGMENVLETLTDNMEEYINQKSIIDFWKLYNTFQEDSWQRYALKEENSYQDINNVYTDYNLDINAYLHNINDYELNKNSNITIGLYETSKIKYNEYVEALNSNSWKEYVSLKIKNLEERKNEKQLQKGEAEEIDFEIELYKLRLENNINFNYDMQNQYLKEYKSNYYLLKSYINNNYNETQAFADNYVNQQKAKISLCKYAIEHKIGQDISNETNVILDNNIDARISFIRTFEHFDLIIVIIAIYISATIITEEMNKRTIKNLLTKPHKRSTILISKIIACIITVIIFMIYIAVLQYIIGGIIFGFNSYALNYIGYDFNNNQFIELNLLAYIILVGIAKMPMYIIITLLCIFIGVINNHTSMSMSLALIIFLLGSTILPEWSKVEALSTVTRYFVTNNWDFSIYLFGQVSDISGVTIYCSIIICLIHILILSYLSIYCFNKKEINNV